MLHQLHSWNLRSIGGPATHLVELRSARHGTKDAPGAPDAPALRAQPAPTKETISSTEVLTLPNLPGQVRGG